MIFFTAFRRLRSLKRVQPGIGCDLSHHPEPAACPSRTGKQAGYIGNMGLGLFLLMADMLKHGREGLFSGPWRSGLFSRSLAFGVMLTSIGLEVVSYDAWQHARQSSKQED